MRRDPSDVSRKTDLMAGFEKPLTSRGQAPFYSRRVSPRRYHIPSLRKHIGTSHLPTMALETSPRVAILGGHNLLASQPTALSSYFFFLVLYS